MPFIETGRLPTKCSQHELGVAQAGATMDTVEGPPYSDCFYLLWEIRSKCVEADSREGEEGLVWRKKSLPGASLQVSFNWLHLLPALVPPSVLPILGSSDQALRVLSMHWACGVKDGGYTCLCL